MTSYNRERYLATAIESVLAQTRQDFELLIWDDGSTDKSLEIARSYAQQDSRVRIVAAKHLGSALALQQAIAETSGDYIGLVDSDDVLAFRAIEETAAVLDAEPEVGLAYTDYLVIDEKGKVLGEGKRCRIPYSKERLLLDLMVFHFRLIRRSVYDQIGGINESFECAYDYDLCLRLSEVTQIRQVKQPLYYYRVHDNSISHQKQLEQILQSQSAIQQALERRGLAGEYELRLRLVSQFSLQKKQ
jgi:glycosyltransferase involved in cell wall biosynthesis